MPRCWINTVSREHVLWGVEGGYTQADHGKNTRLRRLAPGDTIAFYSPKTRMRDGEPLQEFTALATVTGEEAFQVEMTPDFHPWRLAVAFEEVTPAPIRPLIPRLSFITDPQRWGYPFRRGLFEIDSDDMAVIRGALTQG
jgi:hypothetical protein